MSKECKYALEKVPDWYKVLLENNQQELDKQEFEREMLDPSLQQNLNQYKKDDLPLAMRLYNPEKPDQNNQLTKLFKKEELNNQSGKVKGKRDRKEA